jgi:hypothetical protein
MAWDTRTSQLAIFGFVLLILEMLWARTTLVVFAVSFDGMPDFKGSLLALLSPDNLAFIISWGAVGFVFASLIYAVSVVSIPMILGGVGTAILPVWVAVAGMVQAEGILELLEGRDAYIVEAHLMDLDADLTPMGLESMITMEQMLARL